VDSSDIHPWLLFAPMIEDQLVESLEQNRIAEEQQWPDALTVLSPSLYYVLIDATQVSILLAKDDALPLALAGNLGTAREPKELFARLRLYADVDSTLRLVFEYRNDIQRRRVLGNQLR
jgi:hypothetical protein